MSRTATDFRERHAKRNFWLTVGNGSAVMMGNSFIAPDTVIAWLTYRLTGSAFCVGLMISVSAVGWMWPQLLVGNLAETLQRKMPLYVAFAVFRSTVSAIMCVLVLVWAGSDWGLFWALFVLMAAFSSGGGASIIPFMDVVAKAVPQERLAMLWAYRRLFGGVLGFLMGLIVAYVLSERSGLGFPVNYGTLFVCSAAVCGIAYALFSFVREPVEAVARQRVPFTAYLRRGPRILRHDRDFRRLYLYRWAWALGAMSQAQLIPFAIDHLDAPEKQAGWFTAVIMLVGGGASYVWGRITQARGETYSLRQCAVFLMLSPLLAFVMALSVRSPELAGFLRAHYFGPFLLMFALGTIAINGNMVAGTPYLLSLPHPALRPAYLGFINTLSVPLLCAPMLAGLLVQQFSYDLAFGVSCVGAAVAVMLAAGLRKRRRGDYPDVQIDVTETVTTE